MKKNDVIKILSEQNVNFLLSFTSFLLAIYLNYSFEFSIFLSVLVYCLLSGFDASFYKLVVIVFGIISAIAFAMNNQNVSEKTGIISYIALIITLVLLIIKTRRDDNDPKHNKDDL